MHYLKKKSQFDSRATKMHKHVFLGGHNASGPCVQKSSIRAVKFNFAFAFGEIFNMLRRITPPALPNNPIKLKRYFSLIRLLSFVRVCSQRFKGCSRAVSVSIAPFRGNSKICYAFASG